LETRIKIVPASEGAARLRAASGEDWVLVTGYFDPVLAEHAERLAALATEGKRLAVLILDPPEPLLDTRSRAELVAALRTVDLVILPPETGVEAWLDRLPGGAVIREEDADLARRASLVAHVHARRAQAGTR
jgi:glycerol-3-phosphate cytidylyltransferase-like family protein